MGQAATNLPQWQSHKKVWADRIIEIKPAEKGSEAAPIRDYSGFDWILEGGGIIHVPNSMIARGSPVIGDYYVVYKDGYQSWSPGREFIEGYTRVY